MSGLPRSADLARTFGAGVRCRAGAVVESVSTTARRALSVRRETVPFRTVSSHASFRKAHGTEDEVTSMKAEPAWRNLEQRVAQYFERNGYNTRTNHKEQGRSGLLHEIDVLAEKRDAAGTHRVAVECKAWRTPVEKDVVYKLEAVMKDTGLSKGIVISAGGLRIGARVAADQAHIEVWGPDEIRHLLGEDALAGLPIALPDESLGVQVDVSRETAEREVRKARSGFAGIGGEEIASVDLVWLPAYELRLAVTRLRPGVLKDREEVIRRWNLFEALSGRLAGQSDNPRSFGRIALTGAVMRTQKAVPQIVADIRRTLSKHRNARTDAARTKRQVEFNALGLPGSTREFSVEAEKTVFVPYYVGSLRRKGTERLIAVHGSLCVRSEAVEHALHERIDQLFRAIETPAEPVASATPSPMAVTASLAAPADVTPIPPTCGCGAVMVLRHRRADDAAFWGCSTYPRCRLTMPA
jgi:hypothetical protein